MDILQNPLFQFLVMATLAVITIIVSLSPRTALLNQKVLKFRILSDRQILDLQEASTWVPPLSLGGIFVSKLHKITIEVSNSGHVAILPTDFLKPISISCFEGKVLRLRTLEMDPPALRPGLTIVKGKVRISSTLWNAKDRIVFSALVSGTPKGISVSGRVANTELHF